MFLYRDVASLFGICESTYQKIGPTLLIGMGGLLIGTYRLPWRDSELDSVGDRIMSALISRRSQRPKVSAAQRAAVPCEFFYSEKAVLSCERTYRSWAVFQGRVCMLSVISVETRTKGTLIERPNIWSAFSVSVWHSMVTLFSSRSDFIFSFSGRPLRH